MSLEHLLSPRSVAVVGVGRQPGGVGRSVFDALLAGGFPGDVWPVNPAAAEIGGRAAYSEIAALPSVPDLVVVAVPRELVPTVVQQSADAGVRAAIVLTAGFKESGLEGGALERRISSIAREAGMRLLGPNCLGIIVPGAHLNASFAATSIPQGSIGVVTQSGALGTAILDWARDRGGLSAFVSLGNRADVDETELVGAIAALPGTKVVAGYLESVKRGPEFVSAMREVTASVPVVMLKAGSSEAGARAVSSHTGSLAGSDAAYNAAFRAAGVIRAADVEELFGVAEAFAHQPLPGNGGVAILTNAGGPAVLATDACDRLGVPLASLEPSTIEALRACLPAAAGVYNPVDILGDAPPDRYVAALQALAADSGVGAILVVLTPQAQTLPEVVAARLLEAAGSVPVPLLASLMGEDSVEGARRLLAAGGIPAYRYPEPAVGALRAMYQYSHRSDVPSAVQALTGVDRDTVSALIGEARAAGRSFVLEEHAARIAQAYGIATPAATVARSRAEAVAAARRMGYPVAVKVASPDILHKSDIGGLVLGVQDDAGVSAAWDRVLDQAHRRMPDAAVWGVLVQQMVPPGTEVIVGLQRDPTFGPLLMFGLGGVYVEVLRDVSFRLAPIGHDEALRMISETRASALLRGARGAERADIDGVADALARVSALAVDFPDIVELDINPLVVGRKGEGALAADVRIGIGG